MANSGSDFAPLTIPAGPQQERPATAPDTGQMLGRSFASAEVRPDGLVVTYTGGGPTFAAADNNPGDGIFTRVLTPSGNLMDLTPDSIVSGPSIPGDAMRLDQAVVAGFVIENPDGSYSLPGQGTPQGPQKPAGKENPYATGDDGEALEESLEAALGGLAGYTDPNDQINAVNQVVDGGAVSPELLARVAGSQGVAPDAVAGQVESIRAGFEAQARSTVAAMGLDPEAVFTHAWEVDPEGMEKAQRDHATQRSTEGYKALARSYVENLDTLDPHAVLNAEFGNGVTAYQHGDKIILQDHLGRTFEWKAAVRAGIVSVGR